jgi:hypothetical protein
MDAPRDRDRAAGASHTTGTPSETGDSVLREYVINRHGTDYVLYAGLLAEAHRCGLRGITTRLVQIPSPHNGFVAICHAEIALADGTFQASGAAGPENTHALRIAGGTCNTSRTGSTGTVGKGEGTLVGAAETRAKARALCDALGVDLVPIDDLLEP